MFTTFINDCKDDNARARQTSRVGSLLKTNLSFIGVDSDLEAGMQLIDIIDATAGKEGLILVNVAPRGNDTKHYENGTPFAYAWYHETLIVSSIDGYALSALMKLDLVKEIHLLDIHLASQAMHEAGFITETAAERIPLSQFRSFDFTPRVGIFMIQGNHLPSTPYDLAKIPVLPPAIWNIDNFGNCKTTLLPSEIDTSHLISTRFGKLSFYNRLHDVPDGETALVKGSSGIDDFRFLEILSQRRNFAKNSSAKIGDDLFSETSYFRKATE